MTDLIGLAELTASENFLIEWLSKEDWSSYGECYGKDFDRLCSLGLVERRPSNRSREHEYFDLCRLTEAGHAVLRARATKETHDVLKAFAGEQCPICGRDGPHNHSALVVEAFHRANENDARNFGLVTFSIEEIRSLTKRRATGINDRSEPRL